jgi:hypothetical protein
VSARTLCYILTSVDLEYFWAGPGFRKIGPNGLPLGMIPTWPSEREAKAEAERLRALIGLESRAARVGLP